MTPTQTLADLIRSHQDATGDSYGDIAKRAGISKAKVGQLAVAEQRHMPRIDTVEKLARGLRLPLPLVQRAAMTSAGISPNDEAGVTPTEVLAARIERLSPRDREIVMRLVESLDCEDPADA